MRSWPPCASGVCAPDWAPESAPEWYLVRVRVTVRVSVSVSVRVRGRGRGRGRRPSRYPECMPAPGKPACMPAPGMPGWPGWPGIPGPRPHLGQG